MGGIVYIMMNDDGPPAPFIWFVVVSHSKNMPSRYPIIDLLIILIRPSLPTPTVSLPSQDDMPNTVDLAENIGGAMSTINCLIITWPNKNGYQ